MEPALFHITIRNHTADETTHHPSLKWKNAVCMEDARNRSNFRFFMSEILLENDTPIGCADDHPVLSVYSWT